MFFQTKEHFEPTYLDSEEYYKQKQDQRSVNQVNQFSPTESAPLGNFLTGYNNPYNNANIFGHSADYYQLNQVNNLHIIF